MEAISRFRKSLTIVVSTQVAVTLVMVILGCWGAYKSHTLGKQCDAENGKLLRPLYGFNLACVEPAGIKWTR